MEWHRIDGPVDATVRRAAEDTAAAPVVARATASGVRANGWIEARFDMARGSILTAPPAWQQAQLSAQALAPRWMTAALLISMAGLIVLFGLRQQYDPPRRDQLASRTSTAAPDSLAPGLVGALLSNGRVAIEHAMATFLSLAGRGIVSIEEQPRGFLGQSSFSIRPLPTKAPLSAHERALLSITLDETKIGQATSLTAAKRRLVRRFRQFSAAMREDLSAAGLIDPDRKRIRDRYVRISRRDADSVGRRPGGGRHVPRQPVWRVVDVDSRCVGGDCHVGDDLRRGHDSAIERGSAPGCGLARIPANT